MFKNRVLRKIFGPNTDKVTGEWRRLNKELHDLFSSPNIILVKKKNEMGGACDKYGGEERCLHGFCWKS
jgi:hypothetical protein